MSRSQDHARPMPSQAVVLTSDTPQDPLAPTETRVAGLSMLQRTLAMLQWAGIKDALVVVGDWLRKSAEADLAMSRVLDPQRMRVRLITDQSARERGWLSVSPAVAFVGERALLVRADTVFDRQLIRATADASPPEGGLTALFDGDLPVGMAHCTREALINFNGCRWDTALAEQRGELNRLAVDGVFWIRVDSQAAIRKAEDNLWNSCRKPHDGIVSRHLNRNISLFISRRIAHLPISPNHISLGNLVLGLITALIVMQGGYWMFLLGAFLFKLNSILDGVDGELARVRYQMSVVGEWMDTIADDVANNLFFIALAIGAYRMTGSSLWIVLGFANAVPSLLATAYQYRLLISNGRGDLLAIKWLFERGNGKGDGARGPLAAVLDKAKYVVKRDFYIALLLAVSIVGLLPWMLVITTTANLIVLATCVGQEVLAVRMAQAGKSVQLVLAERSSPVTVMPPSSPTPGALPARVPTRR